MTGQPQYPDAGEDSEIAARHEPLTSRQRWARIAVILIVVVLVLALLVLHLTGVVGPGSNGM